MIEKLKALQLKRGTDFRGLDAFEEWADKVEPLLSLSPKHERVLAGPAESGNVLSNE